MILPGSVVSGGFVIENPHLKELPQLTLTLLRHVEHHGGGASAVTESPQFATVAPLGERPAL